MCSVNFTSRTHYHQVNSLQCLFKWGLFWSQNQSRRSGEDSLAPSEILNPDRPALSLGIMTTELFWICCKNVSVDMSSGFDSYPIDLVTVIHVIYTEKTTQRGALWSVVLKKYNSGHQIKKNEMSGACAMYMGRRGPHIILVVGRPRGVRRRSERIILKWIFKKWNRGIWIGLIWLRIGTGGGRLWMW
jgi:hypothetical protein